MRPMSSASVTVCEVAAAAGVSRRTVCRILNGKGAAHRADTREHVLAAAQTLGYLPNAAARAVRRGRYGGIALLLSSDMLRSYLPESLLDGILAELRVHDLHMTVAAVPDPQLAAETVVPKFLRQWMADGLLVNYTVCVPPALVRLIASLPTPAVWINMRRKTDAICIDDVAAARVLTEHLLQLGHRRIAYLDFHNDPANTDVWHYSVMDRCRGYEETMVKAGLPPRVARQDGIWTERRRVASVMALLQARDRPTAVVAYCPGLSSLPVHVAALQCGLHVPRDLSLTTFSSYTEDVVGVALTKMQLPERQMGREAVAMLCRKMERSGPQPSRCLPATFVQGESTAPVRRGSGKATG